MRTNFLGDLVHYLRLRSKCSLPYGKACRTKLLILPFVIYDEALPHYRKIENATY